MKKILVTGASGYIAKHILLQLLQGGYAVRGSVRTDAKAAEVRAAIQSHLGEDPGERLEFVKLDLTKDTGWDAALKGVDGLFHTASPFFLENPKDENQLIGPAVDGTLRALKAAKSAGVNRVILTSSVASIIGTDMREGQDKYDEQDWSDTNDAALSTYSKSKTLAERAAWEFVKDTDLKLTTINPSFVLGAPLDKNYGTSLEVIERFLGGKDPAVPNSGLCIVHVKDVAKAHIKAFEVDASIGERIIVSNEWFWFREMTKIMKDAFPMFKIPTRQAPDILMRFLGLFDKQIRLVVPSLGVRAAVSNAKARELLGMEFVPGKKVVTESTEFIASILKP